MWVEEGLPYRPASWPLGRAPRVFVPFGMFADRHLAHEAQAIEQWLEGHESPLELHWPPRYDSESNIGNIIYDGIYGILHSFVQIHLKQHIIKYLSSISGTLVYVYLLNIRMED